MNSLLKKSLVLPLLTLVFLVSANAQRNRSEGARGNSYSNRDGGNFNRQRSFDRSSNANRPNTNSFNRSRNNDNRVADRSGNNPNPVFRRDVNTNGNRDVARTTTRSTTNFNTQRNYGNVSRNRTVTVTNTMRFNHYNRYPRVYNYNRHGGYSFVRYSYVPRGYVYVGAPRYRVLPRSFITIQFGGYPYYYHRGCFFGLYDGYYSPVFAPIGIHVTILPAGYHRIYVGPSVYYYYDGIYYRNYNDRNDEYEVVDAPMGAVVSSLPKGATAATVNGEKFYEFNGTYYKEGTNSKNEVVYTVVGKNGEINNTQEPAANEETQDPQVGDIINSLPENSRTVTINGEVLYVTPDNLYLKAETNNNVTTYKIVGKGENK